MHLNSFLSKKQCSLFCGAFYNDSAWVFGCGTSTGELFIWDTAEDKNIVTHFGNRVSQAIKPNIEEVNFFFFFPKKKRTKFIV